MELPVASDESILMGRIAEKAPCFLQAPQTLPNYKGLVLTAFANNAKRVDISCCSADTEDFCGNPMFREKVDVKLADFIAAWLALKDDQSHWLLECGMNLYLSQCCYECSDDSSVCDLPPNSLVLPTPAPLREVKVKQANIWVNTYSARSTLHYDANDNLWVVASGTKHVTLLSPCCTKFLCPVPATDENPNHSSLSFDAVEALADRHIGMNEGVQEKSVYRIALREGDMLYIPEGWWHQVASERCSMAINFWFAAPLLPQPSPPPSAASYQLRRLVHELLSSELASIREKDLFAVGKSSTLYTDVTSAEQFAALVGRLSASASLHAMESTQETGTKKRKSGSGDQMTLSILPPDHDGSWLEFVRCSWEDQKRLWVPYANAHLVEWQRLLLSLPPEACVSLLDYWDTLRPDAPADLASKTADHVGAEQLGDLSGALHGDTQELNDFFEQLFKPCGEKVSEVRKHLIRQKNRFNEGVARCLLGEVLGMQL